MAKSKVTFHITQNIPFDKNHCDIFYAWLCKVARDLPLAPSVESQEILTLEAVDKLPTELDCQSEPGKFGLEGCKT